ncbi:MAG: AzlC family ABC transporter permease [Solirubrobacteraceae bacterium]
MAVFVFAVTFGILARDAGMGWLAPLVFSVTTFAGSAQIAAASVLDTAGGVTAAVIAALLLNLRYLPIGLSVAPALRGSIPRRVLEAQLAVDEAWAIAHVGDGRYDRDRLVGAGVIVFVAWVGGTGLGVLGGSVLGDPAALGLDVLSPALFLALLVAQVRDARAAGAALLGASIALACIPWAPAGVPIVAASLVALLGLKGGRR